MAIPTKQSLTGVIVSEPKLSVTTRGEPCFYARIAHETWRYNKQENSYEQGESTFHDLVAYRKTAEHAGEKFRTGDKFVAEGYTRTYSRNGDGETVEVFVADRIGHDCARTNYAVDRTPRPRRTEHNQAPTGPYGANTANAPARTQATGEEQAPRVRQQQLPPAPGPASATTPGPHGQAIAM